MEIVRKKVLTLGAVLIVVGAAFTYIESRLVPKSHVTENWMASHAPTSVDGYQFVPSAENPQESYKMDQRTYDLLQPFGIVSRIYQKGDKAFDGVLIASDRRESFHSPTVCLPAQGWDMTDIHDEVINTKTRGQVSATIARLVPPDHSSVQYIAYFYKYQGKFIARSTGSILVLTLAMFQGPLRGNFDMNTVFYRFTSRYPNATKEELKGFVADYLDNAKEVSSGYF